MTEPLPINKATCFSDTTPMRADGFIHADVRVYEGSPDADYNASMLFTDMRYMDAMNLAALAVESGKTVRITPVTG